MDQLQSYIAFVNGNFMGLVACFVIIKQCLKAYGSYDQSAFVHMNLLHLVSFYPFFILFAYRFALGQGLYILILDQKENET